MTTALLISCNPLIEEKETNSSINNIENSTEFYEEKVYKVKNKNYDFIITYPQLKGESYNTVNELIKKCALTNVNEFENDEIYNDDIIQLNEEYNISMLSEDTLSITFSGFFNIDKTAHPTQTLRTLNYDLKNKNFIKLSDVINVDDNLVCKVSDAIEKQTPKEISEYLLYKNLFNLSDRLHGLEKEDRLYCDSFSITANGLKFNFETIYALGGFASIEVKNT